MQRELTYFAARNCYKKKRNGDVHYVGKGSDRDTDENYRRAWAEWETKLAALVAAEQAAERSRNHRMAKEIAGHAAAAGMNAVAEGIEVADQIERRQEAELDAARSNPKPPVAYAVPADTLAKLAEKFLASKATQARTGQRSGGRYANLRSYLNQFVSFNGPDTQARTWNAAAQLSAYYDRQTEEVDAEEIGSTTASDRMQCARQFIRWLWENNFITDLPRNLDSREMTFSRTVGDVEPMPLDVLRRRIKSATGRLQLELLLMANCGMYQKDCADLLNTEINFETGTITRKRSKKTKGKDKNLPTVTHYLWDSTKQLLKQLASTTTPHALPNRNGEISVRTEVRQDGTVGRIDNAASGYGRLQDQLADEYAKEIGAMKAAEIKSRIESGELELVDGKPVMRRWGMKHIRKTGSTAIGNSKEYSRYAQYFLGQAPSNVADTHYVQPSQEQFRAACNWLGEYLGIDTLDKIKPAEKQAA